MFNVIKRTQNKSSFNYVNNKQGVNKEINTYFSVQFRIEFHIKIDIRVID